MEQTLHTKTEKPLTVLGDSWRNTLRITTVRVVVQTMFFALFLSFIGFTTFADMDRLPHLRKWVGKLLETDPLVMISTAITTHTVYDALLVSLILLVPTLFLGRFFCNWICPLGTLQQFVAWMFRRVTGKEAAEANRYRRSQELKYAILVAMLAAAAFGSLQIGVLDPIAAIFRSFTAAVIPAVSGPAQRFTGDPRLYRGAWFIGFLFFTLVTISLIQPRFFCRVLCPLGALLGVLSRFSWWRIERDPVRCNGCNRCMLNCEGACDPHGALRKSECFVCFNCIEDCPEGAIGFKLFPPASHEVTGIDVSRRKLVFAAVAGALFPPWARATGRTTRDFSSQSIRPPGSVEEIEFLERCIKCDQCIRVCPTNVLQPAWFESGLEGLWSPILNFRVGHCQFHCTACGQVCPTGAIQRVSIPQKLGLGDFVDQGPIRLGTAHFDTGRCLPHSKNIPCSVCEEVCPSSPKAIYTERVMRSVRGGRMIVLAATEKSVTVGRSPSSMAAASEAPRFRKDEWKGDETTRFYLSFQSADGTSETHRIVGNDGEVLTIEGRFSCPPVSGTPLTLQMDLAVPRIDARLCVGCGICERQCPVVGDRRAVYVTAEGETRSQHRPDRDRNRSVLLRR
jgi:polyferredoxin/formate hydrogenlyase subunit 6/NADH:ubiquinone oxidoreductase subunit I